MDFDVPKKQRENAMNEIFIKFEEMPINELEMVFEYLVETIKFKKEQERLKKKHLIRNVNLTINSQQKCSSVQTVDNSQMINTRV